ncbi:unnamed protein product [Angiostrongylus costaricensis]|uniref:RBM26 n=1 Tax=Angiostrongylus costaricensis TaxID=334426 RepID=A0A0R3PJ36_ANGCS|nr:unnamed protein product [Angiostrongylus costaricensis]
MNLKPYEVERICGVLSQILNGSQEEEDRKALVLVHKETIDKIPGAVPGRDSSQMEIYGMQGIPPGTTRGDEEPEAKRDRKDDVPPMPPGPMPTMPPMMSGMPPFPPFPMMPGMPPIVPHGIHGMPPFMPPPPGMGMPPVPPFGMPAPPPMSTSSVASSNQTTLPTSKIGPMPDSGRDESRGDYDSDYRSAPDYNRGTREDGYDYEGLGDRFGSDEYRGGVHKNDFRNQRDDYNRGVPPNSRDEYGARTAAPNEYSRDDLERVDSYAHAPHSRPDFNGRVGPSHDNNLSRDFSREMQPQNDEYGRGLGSRFDRRPDERAERGAGDPYGGAMYNGNGVGTHSSVLNSSAAAVANKLGAKTRIIHPDDHQTTSLEERRAMMISVRGQYH